MNNEPIEVLELEEHTLAGTGKKVKVFVCLGLVYGRKI